MNLSSWSIFLAVRVLRVSMLAYLGMLLLLAGCQRRYIYYPSRVSMDSARQQARRMGLTAWPDDGATFAGWRSLNDGSEETSRRRVLVFHGNAGNALDRTYYLDGFDAAGNGQWDVILLEYPGYGPRDGKPSERAFFEAATAALKTLLTEDPAPVYLVGESLGSGPACHLAGAYSEQVAGVWLVTPFTSLADAARVHYPVFPVKLLLRDRYDNLTALENYSGKLAVLAAGLDRVVPARLARRLYEGASTPAKRWFEQPAADHNNLNMGAGAEVWRDVIEFWVGTSL